MRQSYDDYYVFLYKDKGLEGGRYLLGTCSLILATVHLRTVNEWNKILTHLTINTLYRWYKG